MRARPMHFLRLALFCLLATLGGLLGSNAQGFSDGIPAVALRELPPEARETLALIRQGGPFPYRKDGSTFGNFEKRLPLQRRGYYREYTVPTPGARDRGARRIVTGRSGEAFYTADHYRSFQRIRE